MKLTRTEVERVVSDDTYGRKATELAEALLEMDKALTDIYEGNNIPDFQLKSEVR